MARSLAIFLSLCFLSTAFVAAAWVMAYRLAAEHQRRPRLKWLSLWSSKGLLLPLAIWMVMNFGVSWTLQPFMPEIQAAKNTGGDWFVEFLRAVGEGFFIISSYWAALTLGWAITNAALRLEREQRSDFRALCLTCSIGLIVPAAVIFVLGGWPTIGLAATTILAPIAGYAPTILGAKRMPPMYSRAIARMKFGKY